MMTSSARDVISLVGAATWDRRLADIHERMKSGAQSGKLAALRFAAERAIAKAGHAQPLAAAEAALVALAAGLPALHDRLNARGRTRLQETFRAALSAEATLMPLLHLLHTARLQQARGFTVAFTGLEDGAPFDLLIDRDGTMAEIACDTLSAEDGHAVQRSGWTRLIDRIDPDLQTWLAAHPGRYLLKMTLPQGLKDEAENLPALHRRINAMLSDTKRADYDEAAILRLDPLLLAGAQAGDQPGQHGMMAKLRHEFGPEAQFSVTEAGQSLFVMAARGSHEDRGRRRAAPPPRRHRPCPPDRNPARYPRNVRGGYRPARMAPAA